MKLPSTVLLPVAVLGALLLAVYTGGVLAPADPDDRREIAEERSRPDYELLVPVRTAEEERRLRAARRDDTLTVADAPRLPAGFHGWRTFRTTDGDEVRCSPEVAARLRPGTRVTARVLPVRYGAAKYRSAGVWLADAR